MSTPHISNFDLVVIGGGAAGFFAAIQFAEMRPASRIAILEAGVESLSKVRISGGGRCNVTHACFDPEELVKYYPRGNKELLGPFYHFGPQQTVDWFTAHGVSLKTESDGRMFPVSNKSQSITDCFEHCIKQYGIRFLLKKRAQEIKWVEEDERWNINADAEIFQSRFLLVSSGSDQRSWEILKSIGHTLIQPVPSLFTFKIKDEVLNTLAGLSVPHATVKILNTKFSEEGPVLITHWGLSGPGILKLSAWAARELFERNYEFSISVNWIHSAESTTQESLLNYKNNHPKKLVSAHGLFDIPLRLWKYFCAQAGIADVKNWADTQQKEITSLSKLLCNQIFEIKGKTTFKEEFVTAGGVALQEINFKTFESKKCKNLFLAGEVLNIDALTGGFNFQAAWTGAAIAAEEMGKRMREFENELMS
ncbi:MAG: aminoacetone oxidase family FAD-binding enzyme [Saprospiraceae bacterium]|nr:aminoacetone oxidase family FAD-binding enzyme [Candidatus Vicinibacter affinis]